MTVRLMWLVAAIAVGLATSDRVAVSADWPSYQKNNTRNAITSETLAVDQIHQQWTWRSKQPPQPAWAGPAKWDAYAGIRGLRSMRNYDPVFHVSAVGNRVFFGSSVDDSVYCLDAESGKKVWSFSTDGPVRITPAYYEGKLYFGSDDGLAYCLNAADGQLVWKYRPGKQSPMILNNGHLIPFWPIRTGVVVDKGIAYFGASLLPWKKSYLCALDAATGSPKAKGCYVREFNGLTLEGPLALSPQSLIAPQGRVAPRLFRRTDGESQGSLEGGGGSFVVITPDAKVLHGPGNKTGWITGSDPKTRAKIATYNSGNAMLVAGQMSYLLTDTSLIASNFVKRKIVWKADCQFPYTIILAGDKLFAGGKDQVAAFSTADGKQIWQHDVDGDVFGIALASGRLLVSTDTGAIYAFGKAGGAATSKPKKTAAVAETPIKDEPSRDTTSSQPLLPIAKVKHNNLISRWVFQKPALSGVKVKDLAGRLDATIEGKVRMVRMGRHEALVLDGHTNSAPIVLDHKQANLPTKQITAAAWVRLDQPLAWGGIIGAFQDNGDYERGWILGYKDNTLSFGVYAVGGSKSMTYLTAAEPFVAKAWHHVMGSYDGVTMNLYVDGALAASSKAQSGEINYPPQAFYEIGAYHDKDEYFRIAGMIHEVRVYSTALDAASAKGQYQAKASQLPKSTGEIRFAAGPWLEFKSPTTAIVRWHTDRPSPTLLTHRSGEKIKEISDAKLKTVHAVTLNGLKRHRQSTYTISIEHQGQTSESKAYPCENFFNYTVGPLFNSAKPLAPSPYPADELTPIYQQAAKTVLAKLKTPQGICLVWGAGEGRLAYEIALRSPMRVIGLETDAKKVVAARRALKQAGLYGTRVTILHMKDLDQLPLAGHFANLVVSDSLLTENKIPGSAKELVRMLKPGGGLAMLGRPANAAAKLSQVTLIDWFEYAPLMPDVQDDVKGTWASLTKPEFKGAGEWTHLYGRPDNSAFGGETLAGVRKSDDLDVQWIGRPGPRFQPDRNGRKPSPLSAGGRLFLQGLHRIVALDAHNGTVLWSLEIPDLERFNMPRDCGNWCTDGKHVYAAIRNKCWQIDAATGQVVKMHDVLPAARPDWKFDWGYLASHNDLLIGSAVKQGTSWTNFWGGAGSGWYDSKSGAVTHKVCSDNLFAFDKKTGKTKWKYASGVIVNPSVTIGQGRVYFIETRNKDVIKSDSRRVGMRELWLDQYLVALDVKTGKKLWESPIDTPDGKVVFYLAHGKNTLALVGSGDKKYHINTFNATTGSSTWKTSFPWPSDNHGGHMARPAVIGDALYVRPQSFHLATGKPLAVQLPGGGCGTYACTSSAIFFRSGSVTVWDRKKGSTSQWDRLRPDCWLSTIPAAGMLLSPEGGGGCSCGSWLETSIGFMPVNRRQLHDDR